MSKNLVFFLFFSSVIYGQDTNSMGNGDQTGAEKGKEQFISSLKKQEEGLTKRLNEIRDTISCVEKAQDTVAQQKCREDFRAKRQASKKELRAKTQDEKNYKAGLKKDNPSN